MSESLVKQEFLTELESILESNEAYGSNIQVLTYAVKNEVINGKFKDSWNNRVYEFVIDVDGISYKPAVKLDSFGADELPVRLDAYSEGYGSLFQDVRLDGKLTGKRTKKPKCGTEAFGCGFSCIGLLKTCRIPPSGGKTGSAIGKERLNKLIAKAGRLYAEGNKGGAVAASAAANKITGARGEKAKQLVEARKEKLAQRQPPVKETPPVKSTSKPQDKTPAKPKPEPTKSTSDPTTNPKTHSIKTQKEFENTMLHVMDKINKEGNYDNLIPIHKVREAVGELVSRDKFNEFMIDSQANDNIVLQAGDTRAAGKDATANSVLVPGQSSIRTNVKFTTEGENSLKSLSKTKRDKIDAILKDRPELDTLGTARQYAKGTVIKSQKEFEPVLAKIFKALNDDFIYDNLVPISRVREVLKDRVSKESFDNMIQEAQDNGYRLIGGSSDTTKELKEGGIKTKFGSEGHYIQKEN